MSDGRIDVDVSVKMRAAIECYHKKFFAQSEELCKEILGIKPQEIDALYLLGILYDLSGEKEKAIQQLGQAVTCNPKRQDIHIKLGDILSAIGRHDEAATSYARAIELDPLNLAAYMNLGNAFQQSGKYSNAIDCCNQALIISPGNAAIYFNLANALKALYRFDEAITSYKRALSIQPDFVNALVNLGSLYQEYGFIEESIELNKRVLALHQNDPVAGSNYLLALNYLSKYNSETIYTEHIKYGYHYKHLMPPKNYSYQNNSSLDRCLRIGYVSPDFRSHPMVGFIEPVIANHDRKRVRVICYFNHYLRDDVTERLSQLADEWYDIVHMSDDEVARKILKDKVDILVDLAGHTAPLNIAISVNHAMGFRSPRHAARGDDL
jgi:protein O-GlcNAc transferase